MAITSGRLNVSGETGGRVTVLGDRVALVNAQVDASGTQGGGTVLVGGEQLGLGPEPNALFTLVDENSLIDVSATDAGNGGRAIFWADQGTRFWGQAIARGGPNGGNGGLIETSGLLFLDVTGSRINASAPFGLPGTWLLDPTDITISTAPTTGGTLAGSVFTIGAPVPATANINNAQLATTLDSGTSVTISTTSTGAGNGDITVAAPIALTTASATPVTLTLQADRNISVNSNITSTGRPLNLTLTADTDGNQAGAVGIVGARISTNGGNLIASGQGSAEILEGVLVYTSEINLAGGNAELRGTGRDTLLTDFNHGIGIGVSTLTTTGNGSITLEGQAGSNGSNGNTGVSIFESTLEVFDGNLQVTGRASSGTGASGRGVEISGLSNINAQGTGAITIDGQGGQGGFGQVLGVFLADGPRISANGGDITIVGVGGENSTVDNFNRGGVFLRGTTVENRQNGSISITGTGNQSSTNQGSAFWGVHLNATQISTADGNLSITGTGGRGDSSNAGIFIEDSVTNLSVTGTGQLSLTGTGGTGSYSAGLALNGSISAGTGGLRLVGTGGGTLNSIESQGVFLAPSASLTTSSLGAITVRGESISNLSSGVVVNGSLNPSRVLTIEGYTPGLLAAVDINQAINAAASPITITGNQRIDTQSITARSIDITSTQGGVGVTGALTATGNISVQGRNNFSANSVTSSNGSVSLTSSAGSVQVPGAISSGSGAAIRGQTGITVNSVAANSNPITLTSSAGNIRVTGTNSTGACAGSSLCTTVGAAINITHGGLNDFIVGNASTNGTAGSIFNGVTTLSGLTILNQPGTYQSGQLSVTPGFVPVPTITPTPGSDPAPTPTISPSPNPSPNPSPTPGPDVTPTPSPGPDLGTFPTTNPDETPAPEPTPTPSPTQPVVVLPTPTPTVTPTPTPTVTPSSTRPETIPTPTPIPDPSPQEDPLTREELGRLITDLEGAGRNIDAILDRYLGDDRLLEYVEVGANGQLRLELELPVDRTLVDIVENIRTHGSDVIRDVRNDLRSESGLVSVERFFESLQVFYYAVQETYKELYGEESIQTNFTAQELTSWLGAIQDTANEVDTTNLGDPSTALMSFINQTRDRMGELPIAMEIVVTVGEVVALAAVPPTEVLEVETPSGSTPIDLEQPITLITPVASSSEETPRLLFVSDPAPETPQPVARRSDPEPEVPPAQSNQGGSVIEPPRMPPVELLPLDFFRTDALFTQQFGDLSPLAADSDTITLESLQSTLNRAADKTGIQTGLVYVQFVADGAADPTNPDTYPLAIVLATGRAQPIRQIVPGVTRATVTAMANELRARITNPLERHTTSYLPAAQQLYRWLIAPMETAFEQEQVKNLVFVMDWGLKSLPVGALHDGERFLVQRYSVGQIPSMALIFAYADSPITDLRNNQAQVLAMGASKFETLPPLPFVPLELQTVASDRDQILLNEAFTLTNLHQQRSSNPTNVVHIATHAEFQGTGRRSYVQLWGNEQLQTSQLRDLRLDSPPVELLVLSACRTAVGDRESELGFAGLSVNAGVKTAIASLWYVSDAGTLALMNRLYTHLDTAPTKAEALRQAQLDLIEGRGRLSATELTTNDRSISLPLPHGVDRLVPDGSLAHPYFWSGFTLVGTPW
jgi:CHAT domain-containing protein